MNDDEVLEAEALARGIVGIAARAGSDGQGEHSERDTEELVAMIHRAIALQGGPATVLDVAAIAGIAWRQAAELEGRPVADVFAEWAANRAAEEEGTP